MQRSGKLQHEGGRREEYLDVKSALHRALGRKPWQQDVLDTSASTDPTDPRIDPGGRWDVAGAVEARKILERYLPRIV
jgi:hypothetical protein